jgi:hypothetical protein
MTRLTAVGAPVAVLSRSALLSSVRACTCGETRELVAAAVRIALGGRGERSFRQPGLCRS